ncbi:hypothetical protein [Allorhodopirellula solitaria]|nr:hypothetical protein [Allorhodopirellula solitaria]
MAPPSALEVLNRHWFSANLKFSRVGLAKPVVQRQHSDPETLGGGGGAQ